jgi:hypothetical protein
MVSSRHLDPNASHAAGQLNTPAVHLDFFRSLQTCQEPFLSTDTPPTLKLIFTTYATRNGPVIDLRSG